MIKLISGPPAIFQNTKIKGNIIVIFALFFALTTFQVTVFCGGPEYFPPRKKLSKTSLVWRNNPVGILRFYTVYNKPIVVREKPDVGSKKLLSCLRLADCGFDFVAATGGFEDIKDLFKVIDPEHPHLSSAQIVVTEKKGNWYKIVYHTEWGKEGWAYFRNVSNNDDIIQTHISFTPIEDFFKNAMAVYFLNDPERNEHFLEIKGRPGEDSVTVTKITLKDNLVLIGKPKLKGNWVKVQLVRDNECVSTHAGFIYESYGKPDLGLECPWGWIRWRTPEGVLLMWPYWWDTC